MSAPRTLGLHHVAVQARDVEKVAAFYRDVLGLAELKRFVREDGVLRSVWVSAGDEAFLAVELASPELAPAGGLGFSMVALRVTPDDRVRFEQACAARGVAVERRTGWTTYVRDPEGNLVGLSHHPHDAPVRV
jgi:catechol 2,3-dioxygenase-like lactoylglutathione lyase family enzyme